MPWWNLWWRLWSLWSSTKQSGPRVGSCCARSARVRLSHLTSVLTVGIIVAEHVWLGLAWLVTHPGVTSIGITSRHPSVLIITKLSLAWSHVGARTASHEGIVYGGLLVTKHKGIRSSHYYEIYLGSFLL